MKERRFAVQDGYLIVKTQKKLDADAAVAVLSGRGQMRVTEVRKHNEQVAIVSHAIVCPHCRKTMPAYDRFLHEIFHTVGHTRPKVSRDTIEAWGGAQACFWEDAVDTLVFQPVYFPQGIYTCPHCFQQSSPAHRETEITITEKRGKVIISCSCTDIGELFRIPWRIRPMTHVEFPFCEAVTFNFGSGKTYISAYDSRGNILAVRNIDSPRDWENSKVFGFLKHNTLVRRRLKQSFERAWCAKMPFTLRELNPDRFVKLAAYLRYPAMFYSRIPAQSDQYRAEKSFRGISKRIHTAQQLQSAIADSQLPQSKALRKMLYSAPDLGFYLPEMELLASWFSDINVLRSALGGSFTYPLLSFLHRYKALDPGAFFVDFIRLKGTRALLDKLEESHEEVLLYALQYSGLSASARIPERKKWVGRKKIYCIPSVPYALPMRYAAIPDTCVDGFHFCQLKSKAEYLSAAQELRNCLSDWSEDDNPVFVIRRKNALLGAVEINDRNRILQVRGKRNLLLPEICRPAYEKWRDRFHLSEGSCTPAQEDDDEEYDFDASAYLKRLRF